MSRHYINKQRVFRTLASISPIFLTSRHISPNTFQTGITHSLESKHAINSKKMPPKKSKKPTSLKVPETESARKKLTVAQLRNVLVSLGLSVDGLKADLLLRLETHLLEEKKEDEEKGGEVGARKRAGGGQNRRSRERRRIEFRIGGHVGKIFAKTTTNRRTRRSGEEDKEGEGGGGKW